MDDYTKSIRRFVKNCRNHVIYDEFIYFPETDAVALVETFEHRGTFAVLVDRQQIGADWGGSFGWVTYDGGLKPEAVTLRDHLLKLP